MKCEQYFKITVNRKKGCVAPQTKNQHETINKS